MTYKITTYAVPNLPSWRAGLFQNLIMLYVNTVIEYPKTSSG